MFSRRAKRLHLKNERAHRAAAEAERTADRFRNLESRVSALERRGLRSAKRLGNLQMGLTRLVDVVEAGPEPSAAKPAPALGRGGPTDPHPSALLDHELPAASMVRAHLTYPSGEHRAMYFPAPAGAIRAARECAALGGRAQIHIRYDPRITE